MGETSFQLSTADLVAAYRNYSLAYFRQPRMIRILLILWGFYFVLTFAVSGLDWHDLIGQLGMSLLLAVIILAFLIVFSMLMIPVRARRLFAQQKSLHGRLTAHWDAEGIDIGWSGGQSRYAWGDFVKWGEGSAGVLLYQNDILFNILPRRALSEQDIEAIGRALESHGVPKFGRLGTQASSRTGAGGRPAPPGERIQARIS